MTPDQSDLAVTKAHQRSNIEPDPTHEQMANAIRFLSADAVEEAGSGHPGMPMGMADVATVLYSQFLKFDPPIQNGQIGIGLCSQRAMDLCYFTRFSI